MMGRSCEIDIIFCIIRVNGQELHVLEMVVVGITTHPQPILLVLGSQGVNVTTKDAQEFSSFIDCAVSSSQKIQYKVWRKANPAPVVNVGNT